MQGTTPQRAAAAPPIEQGCLTDDEDLKDCVAAVKARDVEREAMQTEILDLKAYVKRIEKQRNDAFSLAEDSPRQNDDLKIGVTSGCIGFVVGALVMFLVVHR